MSKANAFLSRNDNVTRSSMLLILSSLDPEKDGWDLVKPDDVPEEIKDPDVMGSLVAGEMGQIKGSQLWYMARRVDTLEA